MPIKLIVGILVIFLLAWFIRGAITYFRNRRNLSNAEVRVEKAQNDLEALELTKRAEELEGKLKPAVEAESPSVTTTVTE